MRMPLRSYFKGAVMHSLPQMGRGFFPNSFGRLVAGFTQPPLVGCRLRRTSFGFNMYVVFLKVGVLAQNWKV